MTTKQDKIHLLEQATEEREESTMTVNIRDMDKEEFTQFLINRQLERINNKEKDSDVETENVSVDNEKKYWEIEDQSDLIWAFSKIKEFNEEIKQYEETAQETIRQAEEWLEKKTNNLNWSKEHFNQLILNYYNKERERDPDFKIETPLGKVKVKKPRNKYVYDEEQLIDFLKRNDMQEYINTKVEEKPRKNEIKALVVNPKDKKTYDRPLGIFEGQLVNSETGEIIEGIEIVKTEEELSVEMEEQL